MMRRLAWPWIQKPHWSTKRKWWTIGPVYAFVALILIGAASSGSPTDSTTAGKASGKHTTTNAETPASRKAKAAKLLAKRQADFTKFDLKLQRMMQTSDDMWTAAVTVMQLAESDPVTAVQTLRNAKSKFQDLALEEDAWGVPHSLTKGDVLKLQHARDAASNVSFARASAIDHALDALDSGKVSDMADAKTSAEAANAETMNSVAGIVTVGMHLHVNTVAIAKRAGSDFP